MSVSVAPLVSSIGWTLLHFLWQGLLLGCATGVALTLMRNARPEHRYTVACTALLLCLAWPALDLAARLGGGEAALPVMRFADELSVSKASGATQVQAYLQGNLAWIVILWACCAAALTLRMALGLLWIGLVARHVHCNQQWQARLADMADRFGVTRPVRLRVVDDLASPITAGWWRPVVLVPASLISGMPPDLLEALLAHEMAHIRRLDYLVNLGQNVIEVLLFFHPAVWWISGRIRIEREQIADDIAARELGEPRRLALALSELERFQFSTHHLAQAANGGNLMSRVKRLIRPDTQALNWKAAIPVLGLAFLSACTAVAAPDTAATVTRPMALFASCAKPQWPKASLRAEHTGTVRLEYLISAEGKAIDAKIVKSSGHVALDEAARDGIRKCNFKPGTKNGEAVQMPMQMQYVWTLT